MDKAPCLLNEGLQDFISYISSEKGLSPNTIEAYGRDLRSLINKLKARSLESFQDVK
ncbi:MAG: site-specific integrase, partial [Parachlamydiaceae bacterium]|nr:site-specific integrase [Parachlamydiaceae bacterium]